jgi:ABC-type multidrug transport system ATPase subunit
MLEIKNLETGYGKKQVLFDISMNVNSREIVGIIRPNGAGKSTIFKMITGELKPESGKINIVDGNTIAISKQVIAPEQMDLSIQEFFEAAFDEKDYQLDKKIKDMLAVVNFDAPINKQIKDFSG